MLVSAAKQRGWERKGPPRNHPEISSQKVADFECRFSYDSCGQNRAPFRPVSKKEFWGIIRRPLLLPAPLFYCWLCTTNLIHLLRAHCLWHFRWPGVHIPLYNITRDSQLSFASPLVLVATWRIKMSELACRVWHEPGSEFAKCWLKVGLNLTESWPNVMRTRCFARRGRGTRTAPPASWSPGCFF